MVTYSQKLAGAIALANVEFEERQNTRRSYQIYPQSFMEKNGSTCKLFSFGYLLHRILNICLSSDNVETLRFLKSLSSKEKPSDNSFSSQFQYCREILKENTLKFCKLGMSSQTKSSNDGIKVESNPTSGNTGLLVTSWNHYHRAGDTFPYHIFVLSE